MSVEQRLRDRIEELEGVLGVTGKTTIPLKLVFGFTETESEIAALLLTRQLITLDGLEVVVYGHLPEADQPSHFKTIQVHLSHVRKKFRRRGIRIRNIRYSGWYISPRDKEKIKKLIEDKTI